MARIKPREYRPDVAIPPGTTILEMLSAKGMTQAALAERMKRPANKVNEILHGKRVITEETALELELVLGLPASFWLDLERNYQLTQRRLTADGRLQAEAAALKKFPLRAMIKLGWVERAPAPSEQVRRMLGYFGIAAFSQLNKSTVQAPAFRKSLTKQACPYALAAWLRKGELDATKVETDTFDAKGLKTDLQQIRSFSLLPREQFVPRLVSLCALRGVAVVFVPPLPKSYVSGAAYWLGDKAVIQLSLRFRTNDHLWFSFFHELGHILLHGKKETFLDDFKGDGNDRERQANEFAARTLIPDAHYRRLLALSYRREEVLSGFAAEIGIAPGIVVGRLQHDHLLEYNSALNSLKVRL
jgi:HTH-type transcriptional regulator / antitoxin HigA